jgi:hypothetical protein
MARQYSHKVNLPIVHSVHHPSIQYKIQHSLDLLDCVPLRAQCSASLLAIHVAFSSTITAPSRAIDNLLVSALHVVTCPRHGEDSQHNACRARQRDSSRLRHQKKTKLLTSFTCRSRTERPCRSSALLRTRCWPIQPLMSVSAMLRPAPRNGIPYHIHVRVHKLYSNDVRGPFRLSW